jgi:hypothetical protein
VGLLLVVVDGGYDEKRNKDIKSSCLGFVAEVLEG